MSKRMQLTVVVVALVAAAAATLPRRRQEGGWTARFRVEPGELGPTGRNPWFVLEPGWVLRLESAAHALEITVLDETRVVEGVRTRVVEEREWKDGALAEVSRNFYAISSRTNAVFYFGEEVDVYRGGKVVEHEGAWMSGADGAHFGLMMPGLPLVGARHYQELAPGVAMDRAEVVAVTDTVTVPAGTFTDVVRVEESSPLEPGDREVKVYAPGVGLLRDEGMELVRYGPRSGAGAGR